LYLHVGWNEIIPTSDVLAVCDYESWRHSAINGNTADLARVAGKVRRVGREPDDTGGTIRSVIICCDEVILSPITASTIQTRAARAGAQLVRH
jgi:regulator of extracellular matrix RemA (YlzA/DUF370 family)